MCKSKALVWIGALLDWTAIGIGTDLRVSMAMPACVDGVDLAVWRAASGLVHAWGDRCPHRGMRLSHGFVRGETLSCIYHGWQYDSDGGCNYIPAHPKLVPPKSICATTYACQESGGIIWVALGDTASAPPTLHDMAPVRSMPVAASLADVAAFFGDPDATILTAGQDAQTGLVLQPVDSAHCVAHLLTRQDRKQVSRWFEAQRLIIEGAAA